MKKNIFITGGAGYIGSHTILALLEAGYRVTVFDDLSTGFIANLPRSVKFIRGNILNFKLLTAAMKGGYEAVFHFAAKKSVGESMINPIKYFDNNISGTINILKAMAANKINKIIFSSTAVVYGSDVKPPFRETMLTHPDNIYGFTKLEIERLLNQLHKTKSLRYAVLRYFNAAGYDLKKRITRLEKDPQNLLPIIMEVAAGKRKKIEIFGNNYPTPDGTCIRDYIHVSDLAVAHLAALHYLKKHSSLLVNLGSDKGFSVKEVLNKAREITKKKIPAVIAKKRSGDPAILFASSSQARKILNFKPRYSSLDTIIESMWQMYRT